MNTAHTLRRCIHCGTKAVKPRKGIGRTICYWTMPCMQIPNDILVPTCGRCKSEFLDEDAVAMLAPSLQSAYLQSLRIRTRIAIDILSKHISQRRLELVLGFSNHNESCISIAAPPKETEQRQSVTTGRTDGEEAMDGMETETRAESSETEIPTTTEQTPEPKPKQHRGFAAMDRDAHRELARAGGKAAHANGLAYRFTSEKAREAGKAGGAKTSANREHMVEIGRKGGYSKRGYRRNKIPTQYDPQDE